MSTDKVNEIVKKEPSHSERFTNMVIKEFSSNAGDIQLTSFQKKLCQNYFIKIDQTLKDLERKRLAKDEKYRDPLPYTWNSVNMEKLAVDVVIFSSVGLDPAQPNHINVIPYKNTSSSKFDIGFIVGYKGSEIKAKKYGLDVPDAIIVELVYKNDRFKQLKKDVNNKIESYVFEVVEDFNRGEIIGGFWYHVYNASPEKNKIRVFTLADIEKRKPDTASPEFWGGEKDKWEYDEVQKKRVKKGTEKVEGWFEEMAYKTIYKNAYNAITIDSQKIDDHYLEMMAKEKEPLDIRIINEIKENANKTEIGMDNIVVEEKTIDVTHEEQPVNESSTERKDPIEIRTEQGPSF